MATYGKYPGWLINSIAICTLTLLHAVSMAQATTDTLEPPGVLIQRVSQEVLDIARSDKKIQEGDKSKILELVRTKVFPHVDVMRMTELTAGRFWRQASPQQQQQLADEFGRLLIFTYAGALSKAGDQQLRFKPVRMDPSDTDVIIRSEVIQPQSQPAELSYRLQKTPSGWKVYDINVLGAWLVFSYQSSFESEIRRSGIDGLIKALESKNNQLERK